MAHLCACAPEVLRSDLRLLGHDLSLSQVQQLTSSNAALRLRTLSFLAAVIDPTQSFTQPALNTSDDNNDALLSAQLSFWRWTGLLPHVNHTSNAAEALLLANGPKRTDRVAANAFLRAALDLALAAHARRERYCDNVYASGKGTDGVVEVNAREKETKDVLTEKEDEQVQQQQQQQHPDEYGVFTEEDMQADRELSMLIQSRPVLFPNSPPSLFVASSNTLAAASSSALALSKRRRQPLAPRDVNAPSVVNPTAISAISRSQPTSTASATVAVSRTNSITRARARAVSAVPGAATRDVRKQKVTMTDTRASAQHQQGERPNASVQRQQKVQALGNAKPKASKQSANVSAMKPKPTSVDVPELIRELREEGVRLRERAKALGVHLSDMQPNSLPQPDVGESACDNKLQEEVQALTAHAQEAVQIVNSFEKFAASLEMLSEKKVRSGDSHFAVYDELCDRQISNVLPNARELQKEIVNTIRNAHTLRQAYRTLQNVQQLQPLQELNVLEKCTMRAAHVERQSQLVADAVRTRASRASASVCTDP